MASAAPTPDGPQMIRRAIRAVALARRLVADSKDGRDRRAFERLSRSSASTLAWAADAAERAAHQPDADAALAALRRAVEVYARDRRLGGDPPERVVVTLKAAVRDVPADGMLDEDRPFLMDVVVQWGIEEYYRCA